MGEGLSVGNGPGEIRLWESGGRSEVAMAVKTVGIDLSLRATGVARSADGSCGLIGRDGVTNLSVDQQIITLVDLHGLIFDFACLPGTPDAICIEGLDMARSYGGQIERSALWWMLVSTFRGAGVPVFVAPSPQIKIYATGSGNPGATKALRKGAVVGAVRQRWPQFDVGTDDNKADAAVCAAIAHHMVGAGPLLPAGWPDGEFFAMPDTHTRALSGVRSTTDPPSSKGRSRG